MRRNTREPTNQRATQILEEVNSSFQEFLTTKNASKKYEAFKSVDVAKADGLEGKDFRGVVES